MTLVTENLRIASVRPVSTPAQVQAELDGGLTLDQYEDLMHNAVEECERFFPVFQFVLEGDKSPQDAVEAAMLEPMGEA